MGSTRTISILIANYNGGQFLERALQSALRQDFPVDQYEIILADDGSTDNSLLIGQKYKDRVTLLALPHRGLPATCNEGIAIAQGDYLVRLDADDSLEFNALTKMSNELIRHPEAAFVTTDRWEINDLTEERRRLNVNPSNMYEWIAPGIMFLTKALREVGSYAPLYWEEYDLFLRLLKKYKSCHIPSPLYHYHRHPQSMTANAESRCAGWKALIQKWGMEELRQFGQCQELEETFVSNGIDAKPLRILAAAQDAGGCNSLWPVLQLLSNHPVDIKVLAWGPAQNIFARNGF